MSRSQMSDTPYSAYTVFARVRQGKAKLRARVDEQPRSTGRLLPQPGLVLVDEWRCAGVANDEAIPE